VVDGVVDPEKSTSIQPGELKTVNLILIGPQFNRNQSMVQANLGLGPVF